MKNPSIKSIVLAVSGLLAVLGCFLPFVAGMSLSEISKISRGYQASPHLLMYLIPAAFLLLLGGFSVGLSKRVARWQGIVGTLAGAILMMFLDAAVLHGKFKPMGFLKIFSNGNIGGKLIVVGGVVGLVTALITAVKPDPKF